MNRKHISYFCVTVLKNLANKNSFIELNDTEAHIDHRLAEIGRDLWRPLSPTSMLSRGPTTAGWWKVSFRTSPGMETLRSLWATCFRVGPPSWQKKRLSSNLVEMSRVATCDHWPCPFVACLQEERMVFQHLLSELLDLTHITHKHEAVWFFLSS